MEQTIKASILRMYSMGVPVDEIQKRIGWKQKRIWNVIEASYD